MKARPTNPFASSSHPVVFGWIAAADHHRDGLASRHQRRRRSRGEDSGGQGRRHGQRLGPADRRLRGRLLLGRSRRVPARQRRRAGRLRLRRRQEGHRALRDGGHGHDRPRRIGAGHLRSEEGQLRDAAADLLLGRARPDAAEPPGPRQRHAISLRDLHHDRCAEADRRALYRPARRGQGLPGEDRHQGRAAARFLRGRGLPPGLPDAAPRVGLHLALRPAEDRLS